MKQNSTIFVLFVSVLVAKSIFCASYLLGNYLPLNPDEAQYWLWSQNLDYGYYSKPLGIAYQIALGTWMWGSTEWGVRFVSWLLSLGLSFAVWRLAYLVEPKYPTASLAALCYTLSPMSFGASLIAATDIGMCFFLLLALHEGIRALDDKRYLFTMALFLACGGMFKWTVYVFWPLFFLFYSTRQSFLSLFPYVLLSLLGMLPSFVWNIFHDFPTFKHVYTQSTGGHHSSDANPLEFLASQALLLGPLFYIFFIKDLIVFDKKRLKAKEGLLVAFVSLYFLVYVLMSCFTKIQANWLIYIYPVYFAYLFKKSLRPFWWIGASLCSVFLVLLALSVPSWQQHYGFPASYKFNPFRHHMGWQELPKVLKQVGYEPQKDFLVAHKYQTASIASFYSPQQQRAYFLNLGNSRKNQFDFWPQMQVLEQQKNGYFIFVENEPYYSQGLENRVKDLHSKLKDYFSQVELVYQGPLYEIGGKLAKGILVYKGLEYNGKAAVEKKAFW